MPHLQPQFQEALRNAAHADYTDAWAMPGAYYTSEAMLAAERDLFAREWICVGREDELPAGGGFLATQILDEPIVITRSPEGGLKALSNVCRHRAALISEGSGAARRLVCPYHAWTYDLGGQLIGTPGLHARGDFQKSACRLPEFPCETWQGFVFVNLDPDASPLAPRLAGLKDQIKAYHFEQMATRYTTHETWATNWKSLIENFMEGYHLTPLHKETLHPVNPTSLCRHTPSGDGHFGYTVGFSPDMERVRRGHADLTEEQIDTCVMIAVAPNLLIGGASDYSSFLCVEPHAPMETSVKLGLMFHGDDWTDADVEQAVVLFQDTMREDKLVLDRIGRGLRSARYSPGPLAGPDLEGCVLDLHKYLASRLL